VQWLERALLAGIETLRAVQSRAGLVGRLGATGVDVSNVAGRHDARESEIDILTSSGYRIYWGRAPSMAGVGEMPVRSKLDNLEDFLREEPEVASLNSLDLRFPEPLVRSN
jgi:hypothetical protein